jgi:hypothetical protein
MTENPAYTLEKFLTLLREQEQEVNTLEMGILSTNTVVPDYVELLKIAIVEVRDGALVEAAEAAVRVKKYGASIHDQFIMDAKPVIDRLEKIPLNHTGTVLKKDAPRPADLVYIGEKYTVSVSPNDVPNNQP